MVRHFLFLVIFCFVSVAYAADKNLLVLGDSLSAGYGISVDHGWVALLQERLIKHGYNYHVINASISGDTTAGANARLENQLKAAHPDIAIVELGGNDGLRGLPLDEMYQNLSMIINRLLKIRTRVLLLPIQIPPNFGQVYTTKFYQVYQRLAGSHDVVLGRFLLDGIALNPDLMQSDGIHPKENAQAMILDNIWPYLEKMLEPQKTKIES